MYRFLTLVLAWLILTSSSQAAGKKYALVIGVKTYRPGQPLPDLAFTENDADGLAEVLKAGGYDVTLMTQTVGRTQGQEVYAPLSDYIRDQLSALLDSPFLKDEDVVLIALAGHGVQYELIDDAGKKTPKFYFCPADADVAKLKTANEITDRNRLIDLGELYAALNTCKAGGKLMLVDACRNDPSKPGVTRTLASATLPPLPPPPGGTAVFFSCSAHQQAFEDKDLQHGVFFQQVIDALRGDADTSTAKNAADGEITLAELSEHVSSSTYDYVRKKYQGAKQAPELKGEFRLSIPLISVAVATPANPKPVMPKPVGPVPSPSSKSTGFVAGTTTGEVQVISLPGDISMKFVWCPPGTFTMGSPASEKGRSYDEEGGGDEAVPVTLSRGFWLGQTEVTQEQWESVMGSNPSFFSSSGAGKDKVAGQSTSRYPVESINWYDAVEFCNRLSEREGLPPYYEITDVELAEGHIKHATVTLVGLGSKPKGEKGYRLPSEAEWEYACRAGTKTPFHFGAENDGTKANVDGSYPYGTETKGPNLGRTSGVGSYGTNSWGLSDMHGNVLEWCFDGYLNRVSGGLDPLNTSATDGRVLRGGSWLNIAGYARSANRLWIPPGDRYNNVGIRVSRTQ